MRKLLRIFFLKPILWAASKFSSRPDKEKIFEAMTSLLTDIKEHPGKRGLLISFEWHAGKFIIFSDQHKGRKNGADDFAAAEPNYLAALAYYYNEGFTYINLGDSEELWENNIWQVKKKNKESFEGEKFFLRGNRFIKVSGNHDLFWNNDPLAWWHLKNIYGEKVNVYEGVVLQSNLTGSPGDKEGCSAMDENLPLTVFLTHGHQGDAQSDGNWLSKFFIANIWAPLQAFLRINPNTPAYDNEKKTLHNSIMYQWSALQHNLLLVTGHTHQPVFASLTHLEKLYKQLQTADKHNDSSLAVKVQKEIQKREKEFTSVSVDYMNMKPAYFNTGCCCYNDGDITGIEIAEGMIRLIKWSAKKGRQVLEETNLESLLK